MLQHTANTKQDRCCNVQLARQMLQLTICKIEAITYTQHADRCYNKQTSKINGTRFNQEDRCYTTYNQLVRQMLKHTTSKIDATTYSQLYMMLQHTTSKIDATSFNQQERCYNIQLARQMLQHSTSQIDATTYNQQDLWYTIQLARQKL